MTSIRKEFDIDAGIDRAWDALRDFGAVHERVAPGFLTNSRLDGDDRIVTFFTGAEARERLVSIDDQRRRLVYTVVSGSFKPSHHQASVEVTTQPGVDQGSRLIWITDVLPDDLAPAIDGLMDQGAAAITRAFAEEPEES